MAQIRTIAIIPGMYNEHMYELISKSRVICRRQSDAWIHSCRRIVIRRIVIRRIVMRRIVIRRIVIGMWSFNRYEYMASDSGCQDKNHESQEWAASREQRKQHIMSSKLYVVPKEQHTYIRNN